MKEGKIKDSCIVIAGQSPKGSAYNDKAIGIEFHQGKKAFGDTNLQSSGVWTTEVTKLAEPLDILMSVRAPVGPTNITDRKICIGRGLAAIRCKEGVLHKYVLYALKNIENKIEGKDGAVFNSINKAQIEDFPLPKLSLSEQERIVSYLDTQFAKIDALKANTDKQLKDAQKLFQSALKEYLSPKEGWEELYLVKEFNLRSGEYLPNKEQHGGKIPVYGGNGITGYHDEFNYYGEHILIGRVGALCGNIHYTNEEIWVTDNAFIVEGINDKWNIRFLTYELKFLDLNNYASQTAQPVISNKSMREVLIYKPSLKEQRDIVDILDTLSEKVALLQKNYDQTITLCNDLKQSLLKSIFE